MHIGGSGPPPEVPGGPTVPSPVRARTDGPGRHRGTARRTSYSPWGHPLLRSAHMLGARITGRDRRRPMLLALVFGVVLVLVGVTASALVAVASDHLANATLGGVVNRDATLVELFVNGELRADDLAPNGPGAARGDEIVRIEIRDLDGTVLLSDERGIVGTDAGVTADTRAAGAGEPKAALLES